MRTKTELLLASLALAGCIGGSSSDETLSGPTRAMIIVTNDSSRAIDSLYAEPGPTSLFQTIWNDAPIPPGGVFPIDGLDPGPWEVLAVARDVETRFTAYESGTAEAGIPLSLSFTDADFGGRFRAINASAVDVTGVLVFGTNFLDEAHGGPGTLAPGASHILALHLSPSWYDVRCEFAGGGSFTGAYAIQPFTITDVPCG